MSWARNQGQSYPFEGIIYIYCIYTRFLQLLFFPFFLEVQFLLHFILRFLRYEITRVLSTSIGLGWHFSIQGGVNLPRDSRGARGGPRGRIRLEKDARLQ